MRMFGNFMHWIWALHKVYNEQQFVIQQLSDNLLFLQPQLYVASFGQFQLSGFVHGNLNICSVKIYVSPQLLAIVSDKLAGQSTDLYG